jgi:hypothetical protein
MAATVVKLFDEVSLMREIRSDTITLIHATPEIKAIKKVTLVHDLIDLNLQILEKYREQMTAWLDGAFQFWDFSALKELNHARCEIYLFHKVDFRPPYLVDTFNTKLVRLINLVSPDFLQ